MARRRPTHNERLAAIVILRVLGGLGLTVAIAYLTLAAFGLRFAPALRSGIFAFLSLVLIACAVRLNDEPWTALRVAIWQSSIGGGVLASAGVLRAWVEWHRPPNLPLLLGIATYVVVSLSLWPRNRRSLRRDATGSGPVR